MQRTHQFNANTYLFLIFILLLLVNTRIYSKELDVTVENASAPTRCAEEDNIYIKLKSSKITSFNIEATHPKYINNIIKDNHKPDFSQCSFAPNSTDVPKAKRTTIYETEQWQLVGLTYPNFWRNNVVPVRVGTKKITDIHLLQLWTRFNERAEEVLVLYPLDGYWRARPLPPKNKCWTAYGSSFLIGPVAFKSRPYVDIKEVLFLPEKNTFVLKFANGLHATLGLKKLNQNSIVLNVRFSAPINNNQPFAALRSMYIQDNNADVSKVRWSSISKLKSQETSVMDFKNFQAHTLWTGRLSPSKHNTSALM